MKPVILQLIVLGIPAAALFMWIGSRRSLWRMSVSNLIFGAVGLVVAGHVIDDLNALIVYPYALQRDVIGRDVAGPTDLLAMRREDVGIQSQLYRLTPGEAEALRRRCDAPGRPRGKYGCELGSRINGLDSVDAVAVAGNDILVLTAFR